MSEQTYDVEQVFHPTIAKAIYKEITDTRKYVGEDNFSYDIIEKSRGEKTFLIKSRHISIIEVLSFGNKNCNKCYGTGKLIMNMDKNKIKDVKEYIMLASAPLKGVSKEQEDIIIEKEKAANFWRLLLPCPCTLKGMRKKGMQVLSNGLCNILVEITCTEKIAE